MSYTKTVWSAGDTITAEKLNNIEDGLEAATSGGANNIPVYQQTFVRNVGPTRSETPLAYVSGSGNTQLTVPYNFLGGNIDFVAIGVPDVNITELGVPTAVVANEEDSTATVTFPLFDVTAYTVDNGGSTPFTCYLIIYSLMI